MNSNTLLIVTVSGNANFDSVRSKLEGFGCEVEEVGVCSWEIIDNGTRFACTGGTVSWSDVVDSFSGNSAVVVEQWPRSEGVPYTEDLDEFRQESENNKWRNKLQ